MNGRTAWAAADCIRSRRQGVKIDRIVIHAMDGTLAGTEAWFQRAGRSPPTATHYLVGRDGQVVQMVPDDKRAIHAGSPLEPWWNDRSLGVEHEVRLAPWAPGRPPRFPLAEWTDAMIEASAEVVAILCRTFDIPVDREHIVGHSEVPHRATDSFHSDPGTAFPWDRYMERVAAFRALA